MKLRIVGARGLPELEIEGQIAFRLPLYGRRIQRETHLTAERLARKQIGERVGGSGHMRVRGSVDDGARRDVGNAERKVARLHPPGRRQGHESAVARDREFMAGERSRPFIGHHHRQAGQEIDADVAGGELAVEAVARQAAFVGHRVEVSAGPVGPHLSLQPAAMQVVRAPFAHVGIDELRPQADEVERGAGAGLEIKLERRAVAVRPRLQA